MFLNLDFTIASIAMAAAGGLGIAFSLILLSVAWISDKNRRNVKKLMMAGQVTTARIRDKKASSTDSQQFAVSIEYVAVDSATNQIFFVEAPRIQISKRDFETLSLDSVVQMRYDPKDVHANPAIHDFMPELFVASACAECMTMCCGLPILVTCCVIFFQLNRMTSGIVQFGFAFVFISAFMCYSRCCAKQSNHDLVVTDLSEISRSKLGKFKASLERGGYQLGNDGHVSSEIHPPTPETPQRTKEILQHAVFPEKRTEQVAVQILDSRSLMTPVDFNRMTRSNSQEDRVPPPPPPPPQQFMPGHVGQPVTVDIGALERSRSYTQLLPGMYHGVPVQQQGSMIMHGSVGGPYQHQNYGQFRQYEFNRSQSAATLPST